MSKMRKKLTALAAAFCLILAMSQMTVYANADETASSETGTETETVLEENVETVDPVETQDDTSFSASGNGAVLDDITDDSTKEFFTITTANGNTYFLIIDRSNSSENVYMLSMIDEYDLQDFLEETEDADTSDAAQGMVVLEGTDTGTQEEEAEETEEEASTEESSNGISGILAVILLVAIGGAGAYFYFRIYRPKHMEDDSESENMEFSDGLEMLNEDEFPDKEDDDGGFYDEDDDE